ncbi:MAG: DUF3261 domain-containing protein [Parvibaculum sp.]|uniref:DUF3261 domain-containing protein n=1 Tax=Parvibaculum sp. TaxID=2024848 RepID=UPI0025EF4D3F|nr:DUF3261 domain-containing protein [Parvibaculum sp.]MCE9650888.1 DUF3261 domain-containing protein [Parvibaculum sp.]
MRRVVVATILMLLTACSNGHLNNENIQMLAPGVALTLPETQPFGENVDAVQLVQARYRDRHQAFQSMIETGGQRFTVLMTVPSGPRIMRVDWGAGSVTARKETIAPANLSPERMLADLMLIYAPSDVLRTAISGGTFVVMDESMRKVLRDGREIVAVTRPGGDSWEGHATLVNFAYDYALDIQSHRIAP